MSQWYRGSAIRFDPAMFSVPPSLQKGTSQKLQLWIQSAHARSLDVIAHSGHFPWGKDTDVARFCIQHGLEFIASIDQDIKGLTSLMRQANYINDQNDEEMRNLKFIENMHKTQEIVNGYRGAGEMEFARNLVNRHWKTILALPDESERDAMWKKKYLDRFEQLFKDLIDYDNR